MSDVCGQLNLSNLSVFTAQSVLMLSRGHTFVVNTDQSVDAPCEFHSDDFSMFENPVIWTKFQSQEELPVNIMGNILDPFLATNRFEVVLGGGSPRYQMTLKISGRRPSTFRLRFARSRDLFRNSDWPYAIDQGSSASVLPVWELVALERYSR